MVTSKGFSSGNPKYYSKYQTRLKKLQKRLARKQLGSNNRHKARLKVAKLHSKIADCRKDCLDARQQTVLMYDKLFSSFGNSKR